MGRTRQITPQLTGRQREVLELIRKGHTNTEIAEALGLTLAGAKWHVSELLVKFAVETREELAERWDEERGPATRLRNWWLAASIPSFKPLALGVAGVAIAGAAAAAGVAYTSAGEDGQPLTAAVIVTATPATPPTPMPIPPATLPPSPGAIWAATDALARTEAIATGLLAGRQDLPAAAHDIRSFRLSAASWNPGVTRFESPNGDNYWDRSDGPRNAWGFMWARAGIRSLATGQLVEIEVEVLIEDGKEVLAERILLTDPVTGEPFGLRIGSGFFSKLDDQRILDERIARSSAGQPVRIGWHNDVPDGPFVGAYLTNGKGWCVSGFNLDGSLGTQDWCQSEDDPRNDPIMSNLSTTFSVSGEMGDAALRINTRADITTLVALPGDGRMLTFATHAAPPQSGISRRFAWLNLGKVAGSYTLIGYDAAGSEVYRLGNDTPTLPPHLQARP